MTESQRTTSEQEKAINADPDALVGHSDMQRSTPSSPVGVYDQATTTSTTASSNNMMWIILVIVLIIVAFFILRRWM